MAVAIGIVVGIPIGWVACKYWNKIADFFRPAKKDETP